MDTSETAAMTEASGLTSDHESREESLGQTPGTSKPTDLRQMGEELVERVRKATVVAPLSSLLAAFVLGLWFARRR